MDVRIGVTHAPKELTLEMDGSIEDVSSRIEETISGNGAFLWLDDKHGNRVGIPLDKLAYIEIDSKESSRHVGFGDV